MGGDDESGDVLQQESEEPYARARLVLDKCYTWERRLDSNEPRHTGIDVKSPTPCGTNVGARSTLKHSHRAILLLVKCIPNL